MLKQNIDKNWFVQKLEENHRSVRGLARHMDIDPSAVSRMFSGERRMQMEEAAEIAQFLGVHVKEVLQHAGMAIDLDGLPTRVILAMSIDEKGYLHKLTDPRPLPQAVIDRAQAAIAGANSKVIAAQVRAASGPLAMMDDAVILFNATEIVEPSAIGALSICRKKDGSQVFVKVIRARKTGEATLQCAASKTIEATLLTATPVLAIIP